MACSGIALLFFLVRIPTYPGILERRYSLFIMLLSPSRTLHASLYVQAAIQSMLAFSCAFPLQFFFFLEQLPVERLYLMDCMWLSVLNMRGSHFHSCLV
jgi:hypothetical protein